MKETQPWEINIRKADNGFIASWKEELEEGDYIKTMQQVFEEEDDELGELKNMNNVLRFVKEHFGVYHSKHNKYNLSVKIEGEEE